MIGSPEMLAGNLQALADALGCQVRLPDVADHIAIEPGPPATASVRDPSGGRLLVHSRRDPLAEAAQALAAAVGDRAPSTLVVVGAGLGYLPEVAARRFPDARVLVIEPEPAFVRLMLSRRDWRPQLASGRLLVLAGPGYEGASAAWRMVTEEEGPLTIVHPVLARAAPQAMADGRATVDRIWFGARANADAKRRLEAPYLLNTLRNLPVLAREGNAAALDGRFLNQPAVVVAAGPSLDRQLEDLKAIEDHALIVAVDTAARPLMAAGIQPHLVVAVDPSEANAAHLEGLPAGPGTWLVAETSLHPTAFAPFAGRTFCFRVAAHHPWPWLHAAGFDVGLLRAWGSVLTTAFDLALRMGSSPIVFAGADLAYTGGRPYCRGTAHEHDWALAAARGIDLREVWREWISSHATVVEHDIGGGNAESTARLIAFRDWIVDATSTHLERRVVNATGRGILRGGRIELLRLGDAVPTGIPASSRAVLAGAWQSSAATDGARRAHTAIRRLIDEGQATHLAHWRDMTASHGVVVDDLIASMARPSRETDPATARSPNLTTRWSAWPAAVARVRQFMRREPLATTADDEVGVGVAHPTAAGQDAARALASAAAILPATIPSADPGDLPRVCPISAWSRWNRREAHAWLQFEGALGHLLHGKGTEAGRGLDPLMALSEAPWADDRSEAAAHVGRDALLMIAILESMVIASTQQGACAIEQPQTTGAFGVLSHVGGLPRLLENLLFNAGRQLTGDARDAADSVTIRAELLADDGKAATRAVMRIRPRYLMRALTGLVRTPPALTDAQPSSVVLGRAGALWRLDASAPTCADASPARFLWATRAAVPVVLANALPPCLFASSLNASEAVLGAIHTPDSYTVDESGAIRLRSSWPRQLIGEVPWGKNGGAIAWHNAEGDAYVMLRRTADHTVTTHPLPFRPSFPVVAPDGATFWSCYYGGLWTWAPDQGARLLADTPPTLGIRWNGAGIRLDPAIKHATGVSVRALHHQAWVWTPGTNHVTPVSLGDNGVSWSRCERDGWTAEAYPHADVVHVTAPSGQSFEVACHFPVSVAWAGRSLVVTSTTGGHVLFFSRLRQRLEGSA